MVKLKALPSSKEIICFVFCRDLISQQVGIFHFISGKPLQANPE